MVPIGSTAEFNDFGAISNTSNLERNIGLRKQAIEVRANER